MGKSLQLIPDFTEELVGFMIQSMLTVVRFPRTPFALIPFSKKEEQIYGADAKIEALCPLYIQFKRSFAYPDYSTAGFIQERKQLEVSCEPIALYFDLRAKKPSQKDFQHNILFDLRTRLEKNGKGKAFYVAPLFLRRSAYLLAVHANSMFQWRPWNIWRKDPFFYEYREIITQGGMFRFQNVPILREHIVILPHERVTTHKHRYSYLENGREVCFHDPTLLENGSNLGHEIYEFTTSENGQPTTEMYDLEESREVLSGLAGGIIELQANKTESILDRWLDFGTKLRNNYEIEQFLLIRFKV